MRAQLPTGISFDQAELTLLIDALESVDELRQFRRILEDVYDEYFGTTDPSIDCTDF